MADARVALLLARALLGSQQVKDLGHRPQLQHAGVEALGPEAAGVERLDGAVHERSSVQFLHQEICFALRLGDAVRVAVRPRLDVVLDVARLRVRRMAQ